MKISNGLLFKQKQELLYEISFTGDTIAWPPKGDQRAGANEASGMPDETTPNDPSFSTTAGGTVHCTIDLLRKKRFHSISKCYQRFVISIKYGHSL